MLLCVEQTVLVLDGGVPDRYVVKERTASGGLVLEPFRGAEPDWFDDPRLADLTSVEEIAARHGLVLSDEEDLAAFEADYGDRLLPSDGEG
jgi:hypothetical protein